MVWTIGQFPELDHLEPQARAKLLRRVPWVTYPQMILLAVVGAVAAAGSAALIAYALFGSERTAVVAFVLVEASAAAGLYQVVLRRVRAAMRAEIAAGFLGRRPPFCFGCGYDLRGFSDGRCPECGRPILGPTERR
jgi:hypothetical protein